MKILLSMALFLSFAVRAHDCLELTKCIESIGQLTGKKYLYIASEVKGGLVTTSNTQITAENADTLLTYILDLNGYARIPTAEKNTFMIIAARDIRYQSLPTINVDAFTPPKIPLNYDYYIMVYKFKNYRQNQLPKAANSLRPFMSRYGRAVEISDPSILAIQENATILLKIYDLIKISDKELTKEDLKIYLKREEKRERQERREERMEEKAEKEKV